MKRIASFVRDATSLNSTKKSKDDGLRKSGSAGSASLITLHCLCQVTRYASRHKFFNYPALTAHVYNNSGVHTVQFPDADDADFFARVCESFVHQNSGITFEKLSKTGDKSYLFVKGTSTVAASLDDDVIVNWTLAGCRAVVDDLRSFPAEEYPYLRYKIPGIALRYAFLSKYFPLIYPNFQIRIQRNLRLQSNRMYGSVFEAEDAEGTIEHIFVDNREMEKVLSPSLLIQHSLLFLNLLAIETTPRRCRWHPPNDRYS